MIDVNGVGYEAMMPKKSLEALPDLGQSVHLFIHTHVAESVLALFAFSSRREKTFFKRLISVSGIGPKLAIQVMSGLAVDELIEAITTENLLKLTSISGIGKKTAERLVVELKDKMLELAPALGELPSKYSTGGTGVWGEVYSALMNLGYQRSMADKAVSELKGREDLPFERAFKQALALLAP